MLGPRFAAALSILGVVIACSSESVTGSNSLDPKGSTTGSGGAATSEITSASGGEIGSHSSSHAANSVSAAAGANSGSGDTTKSGNGNRDTSSAVSEATRVADLTGVFGTAGAAAIATTVLEVSCTQDQHSQNGVPCTSCATGSYRDANGGTPSCKEWSNCGPGTFVANTPSATADRSCSTCPAGTFAADSNQIACQPYHVCTPGTMQLTPGSASSDVVCVSCSSGNYCPGGTAQAEPCASGTWDDDRNPATPCVAKSSCTSLVLRENDAVTDRICAAKSEQCWDGVDNDGDGAVDCDDSECAAASFECVPSVERAVGWVIGANEDCPTGLESSALYSLDDLKYAPLVCEQGCTVGCPSTIAVGRSQGSSCQNLQLQNIPIEACTADTLSSANTRQAITPKAVCKATVSIATRPQPEWLPRHKICTAKAGGGCAKSGERCLPRPRTASAPACTVLPAGATECPAPYMNASTYFDGTTKDTRDCGIGTVACSASGSCEGKLNTYCNGTCAGSALEVASFGSCLSVCDKQVSYQPSALIPQTNATCKSSGAATPTGGVTGTTPITVCCMPDRT